MKKIIIALIAISSFQAFASDCNIRIERIGNASADIKYKNQVITQAGEEFGFIRNYSEVLNLEECIELAKKEANFITNHESVTRAKSQVTVKHSALPDGAYKFEVKSKR
jgi:hypothetical protein